MRAIIADITTLVVDAVVNAANTNLLGGGGVDGAIHAAAGERLLWECRKKGGCEPGDAKVTEAYNLPAKCVIHTVGPIWHGGDMGEPDTLESCYETCLRLAVENGCKSIAFPCISTGIFGYPPEDAASVAVSSVWQFLETHKPDLDVTFCCFGKADHEIYQSLLKQAP